MNRVLLLASILLTACAASDPQATLPALTQDSKTLADRDAEETIEIHGSAYGPYPARWWAAVPEKDGFSWEVLPQAATPGSGRVILSKRHELGLLSNFAPTPFEYRGKRYASLEGFWQCMKYPEGPGDAREKRVFPHTREEVAAMVGFDAHSAGVEADKLNKELGIDWITFEGERIHPVDDVDRHYELILAASRAKVAHNAEVEKVLLSTGDLILKPDHDQGPEATKAWRYHEIYMRLRHELRQ